MEAQLIIDRLKALVPDLGGRVAGAAEMAQLSAAGKLPQVTPVAHVVPAGIGGGKHHAQTGAYVQDIERLWAVVLTLRVGDPSGARAMGRLEALVEAIVAAIAGWALGDTLGVMTFRRAQQMDLREAGVIAWHISFSIKDQLRFIPA